MDNISVFFGKDRDVSDEFSDFKSYMFASIPSERRRQLRVAGAESVGVPVAVFDGPETLLRRSSNLFVLFDVERYFDEAMERRGLTPYEMGCVEVVFDPDDGNAEGLDAAIEFLATTLSLYALENDILIGLGIHVQQYRERDGVLEPPHAHILWQRTGRLPSALPDMIRSAFLRAQAA